MATSEARDYLQCCQAFNIEPRKAVVDVLNQLNSGNTVIALNGNRDEFRKSRISREEAHALSLALKTTNVCTGVDLSYNNLPDAAASKIAQLLTLSKQIVSLNLAHNSIGPEGARELVAAIKANPVLRALSLHGNANIGPEGGAAVAALLAENSSLEDVDLGNTELDTTTVVAIAVNMLKNTSVRRLSIENPRLVRFQDQTVMHIAQLVKQNRTIEHLSLAKNGLSDAALIILLQYMALNTSLRVLELQGNKINQDGGVALGRFLASNSTITTLNLAACRICDDGAVAFADALKTNQTLTELDISHNSITSVGLEALAASFKVNTTLRSIKVYGNRYDDLSPAEISIKMSQGATVLVV